MEELLRQAFQLGQQWVQDMNNDKEPTNFNQWYDSDEVQEQVKNCSIPDVVKSFGCGCNFCDAVLDKKGVVKCGKCNRYE